MPMKLHLAVFFIFMISKFNNTKGKDIEQDDTERFGSTMLKKYEERIQTNASNMNNEHFRMRSRRELKGGSCNRGCGFANMKKHIRFSVVKGDDVDPPYKYPWMVAVKTNGKIGCTGSIINEYFILTAAHCFIRDLAKFEPLKRPKKRVSFIRAREVSIDILNKPGPPVQRVIPHSGFTIGKWKSDIALLKLGESILCDEYVSPICLPPRNFVLPGKAIMTISGYGSDDGQGEPINYLKEAKVKQVGFRQCTFPNYLKERMYYCVKGVRKQTACYGDSGGPMFYARENIFYAVGVASFGKDCDTSEPFLYTSVPNHLPWIYGEMRRSGGYSGYSGAGLAGKQEEQKGEQLESSHKGETAVADDAGAEADDAGAKADDAGAEADDAGAVADDAGAQADDAGAEAEYAGAEAENAGSEAGYLGRGYSAAKGDVSAIEGAGDFDGAAAGHGFHRRKCMKKRRKGKNLTKNWNFFF